MLELSHEIDYLRWIFGEIVWVQSTLLKQSTLEINVEDTAHLIIGFKSLDDRNQLVTNLSMDFIRHDTTCLCTVIGEGGSLRWNGLTETVEIYEAGATKWRNIFRAQNQRDDSYLEEWMHFLSCVEVLKTPLISGYDGLAVLKIIEATRQSSASGCKAFIDEV